MKRLWIVLVVIVAFVASVVPALSQDAIKVTSSKFTNNFPKNLTFELQAQGSAKITRIELMAQVSGLNTRQNYLPQFTSDTTVSAKYEWFIPQNYLPPGAMGEYWWVIQDSAGNQLTTPKQSFRVENASYPWQKLTNDKLALYWYGQDAKYGQAMFDRGNQTIGFVEDYTGAKIDRQVQVYIYHERSAFLGDLDPRGVTGWEGGVTMRDYSCVLVDEEGYDWTLMTVAHELTHVIIGRAVSGSWASTIPTWMNEGLAMYFETTPGTLTSQMSVPLKRAIQTDTLLSIRSLNGSFPTADVDLAYGESWSAVDFIIRHYGKEKLGQLLQGFKSGGTVDDILTHVLGVDTDAFENEWRKDIGAKPRVIATRSNAQPTAFPTFGLSTEATPIPGKITVSPTATPEKIAAKTTPLPVPTSAPSAPPNPLSNLCGGTFGLIALGVCGAVVYQRRR